MKLKDILRKVIRDRPDAAISEVAFNRVAILWLSEGDEVKVLASNLDDAMLATWCEHLSEHIQTSAA